MTLDPRCQLLPGTYHPALGIVLRALFFRPRIPPGKARHLTPLERVIGRRRIVVRTEPGFLFACDQQDWLQRNLLCNRVHEPEITALLRESLNPDDVFFDIGANSGYFSCLALSCEVKGVVAFEPDPNTCAVLAQQQQLNNWSRANLRIESLGLSDRVGTQTFIRASDSGESGFGSWPYRQAVGQVEVGVQTLDYFCQQANMLPTVLKIDVEGWEYPVLCGAEQTLGGGSVRLVVFESECDAKGQILDPRISQLLGDCGFAIRHVPRPSGVIKPTENYQAYSAN